MNLQLLTLIIWPKNPAFAPQEVPFKLGAVNVITGSSRSGKSAIIPIIDYCLASSDCFIPIDVIRDHASWYGVALQCDERKRVLIARRAPAGSAVSNDYYVEVGHAMAVPTQIPGSNQNTEGVKVLLNDLSGVPAFRLNTQEDTRGYQARLGFRDLMALVFQSQDIVANQNIVFYKTHAHEHRERLRNWFPYILGAETIETLAARQRLDFVDRRINQLRREIEKVKQISNAWLANITGHLEVARQYGLFSGSIQGRSSEELLSAAKWIVENASDSSQPNMLQVDASNKAMHALEADEDILSDKVARLKKRLSDIERLREGIVGYQGSSQKRADRLQLSRWLMSLASESHDCPLCGNGEHQQAHSELAKISSAFELAENESRSLSEIPPSFLREEQTIRAELEDALSERKALAGRIDKLIAEDKEAREQFQRRKNLFIFLGRLKASLEMLDSVQDGGPLADELTTLEQEKARLLETIHPARVQRMLEQALTEIGLKVHSHLKTLDVDEQYRRVPPRFSVRDLSLQIASKDADWHFLAEVGSASNWVSFHIALMCGLQEYFLGLPSSCVPNFVIFDQPSQVYFPKLKRSDAEPDDHAQVLVDEDAEAVRKIFETLMNSVKGTNNSWQCIVLDHADDGIYGDIPGINEVAVWRNGNKLIPPSWYS